MLMTTIILPKGGGSLPCIQWEHMRTKGVFKGGIISYKVNVVDPSIM